MKAFLIDKLGEQNGSRIWELTQHRLGQLRSEAPHKSRQQTKVLRNLLLPRIALYQVLLEQNYSKEQALKLLEAHMVIANAIPMRKKYDALDRLPCAYFLFRTGFAKIVRSSDLWDADVDDSDSSEFHVTMHRCFWHDTFAEYGCPEICQFACQCDDLTYSDLHHIDYSRTQTLGTGGTCCDFYFRKRT